MIYQYRFALAALVSILFVAQALSAKDLLITSEPSNALISVKETGQSCRTPCKLQFDDEYFDESGGNWLDSSRLPTGLTATISLDGYETKEFRLTGGPLEWVGRDLKTFRIPYYYITSPTFNVLLSETNDLELGIQQLNHFDYGQALASFASAIRKNPRNADAYFNSYRTYLLLGRRADAAEMLRSATGIKPSEISWQLQLADLYNQMHRPGEAAEVLERLVKAEEAGFVSSIYSLGSTYAVLNRLDEAAKYLDILEKLDPKQAETLRELIDSLSGQD